MGWKTYKEQDFIQSFSTLSDHLKDLIKQLQPSQQIWAAGRLDLSQQEWETNSTSEPGRLFRPAALKLANVTKIIASNLNEQGLPADAAEVSNLSFELYHSFQNDKYSQDMANTLQLYASTAYTPITTSLAEACQSINQIVSNLQSQIRSSIELAALTGLADTYDEYIKRLKQLGRDDEEREFLSANLETMLKLANNLGNREASILLWREEGQQLVPELMEQFADQNVPGVTITPLGNLPSNDLVALQQAVQEVGYERVYKILERHVHDLQMSLSNLLNREQNNIIEPPTTIKDRNPKVVATFNAAMEQRSRDAGKAIRTLEEAYRLNPSNDRLMEWLGTLYLRQANILRARQNFESISPRWISFTRDWNLSSLYRQLGQEGQQLAFELLSQSFQKEPRLSTLQVSLALALERKHHDYLIEHLRETLLFEGAAYGFTLAYEQKNRPAQDVYLAQLDSYLSDGVPTLPALSLPLADDEIDNLKSLFISRRLIDAGIIYFEDRYRRQARSAQSRLILQCLINLLEAAKRFERVLERKQRQFENDLEYGNILEGQRISRLQDLLRYCREHNLTKAGAGLLEWASKHNITLTDDQRTHWRKAFGVEDTKALEEKRKTLSSEPPSSTSIPSLTASNDDMNGSLVQSEANNILATTNPEVARLLTVGLVLEHREQIHKCLWAVETLIGSESRPIIELFTRMITALENFQTQPDLDRRRTISQELLQLNSDIEHRLENVSNRNFVSYISGTRTAISRAVRDAASRVNTLPVIEPQILNDFLSDRSDIQTTLVVELDNKSDLPVLTAEVNIQLVRGTFIVTPEDSFTKLAEGIPPKQKRVVTFELRRNPDGNGNREIVMLSGIYDAQGMKGLPLFEGLESSEIPIKSFKNIVEEGKVRNPYIATGAVPFERPENFHGRGELLDRIRGSVADQEGREALFINGIRRIGKTSLVNMLEGAPPEGLLSIKIRLDTMNPVSTGMFFYAVASLIAQKIALQANLDMDTFGILSSVVVKSFEERPQIAFPRFLDEIVKHLGTKKLFLMFDEFQIVTEAIQRARAEGRATQLDVSLLDMLRGYLEERRFLALFTGSLLFAEIRQHVPDYNRLWGSITPIDAGFVDADAVGEILRFPAKRQNIFYTDAAVERTFDYTQGYAWFVQMIGTEIIGILNAEERLCVSPQDIDRAAAELVNRDYNFDGYWWERERFESRLDGPIIRAILDEQPAEWVGLPSNTIVEAVKRGGFPPETVNQRIAKLRQFHILDRTTKGQYRIKALILERWLQLKRAENDGNLPFGVDKTQRTTKQVAVVVDHENIWFGLVKMRDQAIDKKSFVSQTSIDKLVSIWTEQAQKYGHIAALYAIADWHNPSEIGPGRHQQVYRTEGFETPLPIIGGKQAADNELRDRVTKLLLDHPEINLYILVAGDGHYAGLVELLLNNGKEIVIWSLRDSIARYYEDFKGRRGFRVEYVEDILSLAEF